MATGLIRTLLLGVAAIAIAAGLYLLFGIVRDWQQQDRGQQTLSAAQDLEVTTTARYLELRERFKAAVDDAYLRADADARAFAAAEARFAASFPGMRELAVLPPDLDSAFAGELGDFGYGRLWLAVRALGEGGPVSGAVASAGGTALGLAQKLSDEVGTVGVVVAELPAEAVAQTVGADPRWSRGLPVGLYLAEAQVAGAAIGSAQAGRIPIGGSGLEIRYTEPNVETAVPMGRLLTSLLALVLGGWLLLRIFRASREGRGDTDGPTLAEAVAADATSKPAPIGPKVAPEPALPGTLDVSREIFRAYDIRGVVGKTLDEEVAKLIGRAIGSEIRSQGLSDVVVGRDGRLSGPEMLDALTRGLREAGCDVADVGLVPTPVVYFGVTHLNAGSGVAVTGSHNPPDYNGFKVVIGDVTLAGSAIQDLYRRIAESDFESGHGSYAQRDVLPDYVDRIANDVQAERRLKVVVDCGNGAASEVGPQVLEAIGCDVTTLYCEIDGNFPNHHPDPSQPENLRDLATTVQRLDADLGIAFDGDGDRLGVINRAGEIIYPDRLLMLFAQDVLYRNPGASIIYDVKCTGHLSPWILRHGGSPLMWKTGHSLIKAKMRETDAELAGEMSGHFFFRERWFGFDDGIYAAARLLEILAGSAKSPDEIFAGLPAGASTPELNIKMNEGEPQRVVERFRETTEFEGAKVTTIDGVRVDWPDGFGLVRCSNTTPCLVLRFDADDGDALARIQGEFRDRLTAVAPELELPF